MVARRTLALVALFVLAGCVAPVGPMPTADSGQRVVGDTLYVADTGTSGAARYEPTYGVFQLPWNEERRLAEEFVPYREWAPVECEFAAIEGVRALVEGRIERRLDRVFVSTPGPGDPVVVVEWVRTRRPDGVETPVASLAAVRDATPAVVVATWRVANRSTTCTYPVRVDVETIDLR